jgi:hypothetical protein
MCSKMCLNIACVDVPLCIKQTGRLESLKKKTIND